MDLPMSLPYLWLTAPSWPLETETVSPAAMEERPTWEPEAWGSPGGWLAPREARAGGGVGGRPAPSAGGSPEGGRERRLKLQGPEGRRGRVKFLVV